MPNLLKKPSWCGARVQTRWDKFVNEAQRKTTNGEERSTYIGHKVRQREVAEDRLLQLRPHLLGKLGDRLTLRIGTDRLRRQAVEGELNGNVERRRDARLAKRARQRQRAVGAVLEQRQNRRRLGGDRIRHCRQLGAVEERYRQRRDERRHERRHETRGR